MGEESLKNIVQSSVQAFPAVPHAATEVLNMLADANSNAAHVERALRMDPGLTANTLKLANSAYYGAPGEISSVQHAITRIGWNRMSQLVTAAAINGLMEQPVLGYGLPAGELWRHSIAVSVAAEIFMKECGVRVKQSIFTAALLHDVGKLVMGKFVEPYYDLIEMAVSRGLSFDRAEREVLGVDHAQVGAWILEHWSFPAELVNAVRWHHQPDEADAKNNGIDLVHLADVFCLALGIGLGKDGIQYLPSMGSMARVGIKPERLKQAAEATQAGLEALTAALG